VKTGRLLVVLLAAFSPTASILGQLVHATFEGTFVFTSPPFLPIPRHVLSDPAPYRIDAYYDSTLPGTSFGGHTNFYNGPGSELPDPSNYLRWRSEGNDWTVPITQLSLNSNGRFVVSFNQRIPYLDVILYLADNTPIDRLPVPPFALSSTADELGLIAGGVLPIKERAYFDGTITRFEAEIVPVPEPATFAAIASAGLLAIILAQRRRKCRNTRCART
jgi:hypothetical protein